MRSGKLDHGSLSGARHSQSFGSEGTDHSLSLLSLTLGKPHLGSAVLPLAWMLKFDHQCYFLSGANHMTPGLVCITQASPGFSLERRTKAIPTQWLPAQL